MSGIVKAVTRLAVIPMIVFGCYLLLRGHISHGVGFAGGVIIALSLAQLILSFGRQAAGMLRQVSPLTAGAAALLAFLLLGLAGALIRNAFFAELLPAGRPHDLASGGSIVLYNAALCIAAAAGLSLILRLLAAWKETT